MNKQTKVKITLVIIPIVVIFLIAAVVALILTINKMQKDSTGSNESLRKATENVSNTVNTTNTTNTTNTSNTSNSTKSEKTDKENTTDKKNSVSKSVEENRRNTQNISREGSARDVLTMALSRLSSEYFAGELDNVDKLTDTLTAEGLEDGAPEYIFEVDSWNKDKESAMVRMQLKRDDSSPVYVAEVSEQLTILSFEKEDEE